MTDEKTGYKILSYFAVLIVFVCFLFRGFGEQRDLNRLQNDTDRTVGIIKTKSANAGIEIIRIERTSGEIGGAVKDAIDGIGRSQKSASTISNGIEGIKRTIKECRELVDRNSEIIERLDGSS